MAVQATLGSGASFAIETSSGHSITLDLDREHGGANIGPSPMEVILVGLAGCVGMSMMSLLAKRQQITAYKISVRGERAASHPQVFKHITVEHIFTGHNIQSAKVQRALELTEERYCGASAMLDKTATISHTIQIIEADSLS
ncbi:OsmC family peroxiredoxin [Ktedonosporobacter rubrisoli]|uniref:OsmC family peroxiredoxin n=2 Tax=Ktedonosporobacter rubrisoli TaxID=2509675 RepID=A0A4P6K5Y5_KTERU|nr:OsmC family peroxiredoxin [Ktedonosporobacter rubrisoli]